MVLILLLNAAPSHAHAPTEKKEQSCCKAKKTDTNKKKDCCENNCNPFVRCCSFMGFSVEKSELPLFTKVEKKTANNFHYTSMLSSYESELWQPPKV